MTHRSVSAFAFSFVFALLVVGCGTDCKSNCEDARKCDGSPLADTDCDRYCEKLESLNEKSGCEDQYDDLLSCVSDEDDVCKADACGQEQKAYDDCQKKYCDKHLQECAALIE